MKTFLKMHEWLADNVSWIQYPNVIKHRHETQKTKLGWCEIAGLLLYGLFAIFAGLMIMAIGFFIFFTIIMSLFS